MWGFRPGGQIKQEHTGRGLDQNPRGPLGYTGAYAGHRLCTDGHEQVGWTGVDIHCWFCGKVSLEEWEYHDLIRQGLA